MARETNNQQGGDHYKKCGIEPVEYAYANNLNFAAASIVKYVTRHKDKGGAEDIKKIKDFCDIILEFEYGIKRGEQPPIGVWKENPILTPHCAEDFFWDKPWIKEGSDCIAVLKSLASFGGRNSENKISCFAADEKVVWEDMDEESGDLRVKRQNGETLLVDRSNADLFDVVAIAQEVDLKKKGLTERQIKDILFK